MDSDSHRREIRKVTRSCLRVIGCLAALWSLFMLVHVFFPYLRAGHILIYQAKQAHVRENPLFHSAARHKILVFGNSRMLAGFVPSCFDSQPGADSESYNLAYPEANLLLGELEAALAAGSRPTDVFITLPWRERDTTWMPRDETVVETLFPFRRLMRNAALFYLRSGRRGGMRQFYAFARDSVQDMLDSKGYYFVEGQSHFANHQLPPDFCLASDTPETIHTREFRRDNETFEQLCRLGEQYGIHYYIIPVGAREGQWAVPPSQNAKTRDAFASTSGFTVLGPDYFLLPNREFSDPIHLNPHGAQVYTKMVYDLFRIHRLAAGGPANRDSQTQRAAD